jgi:hypothetical protein
MYDPVSMWPHNLSPIGTMHSLLYFLDENEQLVNEVHTDIKKAHEAKFGLTFTGDAARTVPLFDNRAFKCLHLFPIWLVRSYFL